MTYYLPETQLRVDAKRTESEYNVIKGNATLSAKQTVDVTADVKSVVVPDRTTRNLDLGTSAVRDLSLTVTVSPDGYLQAINTTSTGKAGDLISNIFQIAGRVVALAGLAANTPGAPLGGVVAPAEVQCSARVDPVVPEAIAVDAFIDKTSLKQPDPTWFGKDDIGLFYVTHSSEGCNAWKQVLIARRNVRTRQHELNVQQGAKVATNGHYNSAEAAQLEENLSFADSLLRRAQASLDEAQTRYGAGLSKFKGDFKLEPKAKEKGIEERHESFSMAEIPPVALFNSLDKSNLQQALQPRFTHMRELTKAGVAMAR
ncbi:MAG TPA: hypothetical protein VN181_08735, partial [Thermoanaerobaculia bacterium]|nr:hypothetical protein [Thermoanaerobaculia bacterium]